MKKKTIILLVTTVITAVLFIGIGFVSSSHSVLLKRSIETMTEAVEKSATALPVGQTFIRKVIVYTYNSDNGQFERYGTMNMYNDADGNLLIGNEMPVHENRDIRITFRYWAADDWDTYYYFD